MGYKDQLRERRFIRFVDRVSKSNLPKETKKRLIDSRICEENEVAKEDNYHRRKTIDLIRDTRKFYSDKAYRGKLDFVIKEVWDFVKPNFHTEPELCTESEASLENWSNIFDTVIRVLRLPTYIIGPISRLKYLERTGTSPDDRPEYRTDDMREIYDRLKPRERREFFHEIREKNRTC